MKKFIEYLIRTFLPAYHPKLIKIRPRRVKKEEVKSCV
jgi:hypothetical protein